MEEDKLLGFADDDATEKAVSYSEENEWKSYEDCKNEVLHFPGICQNCGAAVETLMKPTGFLHFYMKNFLKFFSNALDIPYFQTVIVMCTICDRCGYKSNDVQSGGATKELGCKLSVRIEEVIFVCLRQFFILIIHVYF